MRKLYAFLLLSLLLSVSSLIPVQSLAQVEHAYDITRASYDGVALDISEHVQNSRSVELKPDGTRLYVIGRSTLNVAEYHMSTPWDLSTAVFKRQLDISEDMVSGHQEGRPHGLFIDKENGQDMYIVNRTELYQYELTEPWDITSAERVAYMDMRLAVNRLHDIHISPDGNWLYIDDRNNHSVYQFQMGIIWDITTLSLRYFLDIDKYEKSVRGMEMTPDGTRLFLVDQGARDIIVFDLEEPYMLKSAKLVTRFDVAQQSPNPRSIAWNTEGTRFYITCNTNNILFQYSIK